MTRPLLCLEKGNRFGFHIGLPCDSLQTDGTIADVFGEDQFEFLLNEKLPAPIRHVRYSKPQRTPEHA